MTYTPVPIVELALGGAPFDDPDDLEWTDVSEFVHEVVTSRGEESELASPGAGTTDVTLDNSGRDFDPTHATGPFFGDLAPDTPLRVRATLDPDGSGGSDPVDYPISYGYVEGFPLSYSDGGIKGEVQLTASDALRVLGETALPSSVLEVEVKASAPLFYWPMGTASGDVVADASGNRHDGAILPAVTGRAGSSIAPFSASGSIRFDYADFQSVELVNGRSLVADLPFSFEAWVQFSDPGDLTFPILYSHTTPSSATAGVMVMIWQWNVGGSTPTNMVLVNLQGGGVDDDQQYFFRTNLYDDLAHYVVVVIDTDRVPHLYVDLVEQPIDHTVTASPASTATYDTVSVGGRYLAKSVSGLVGDVAVYDVALDAATRTAHYEAATNPWAGDTTGARATRILDLVGWPAALREIDTGEMRVAPARLAGLSAGAYLLECQRAEQGRLFVTRDGKVAFHNRGRFLSDPAEASSQFDFVGDDDQGLEGEGIKLAYDNRFVFGTAVVSRDGGAPVTVVGAAPTTRTFTLSGLILANDGDSRLLAEYVVARYAEAQVRADAWTMQPELNPEDWADLLGLERGHFVTLDITPGGIGAAIGLELHVARIAHRITPEQWEIDYYGTPRDPNAANYFTWDGDDTTQGWDVGLWR